jgi:hypothetical protein
MPPFRSGNRTLARIAMLSANVLLGVCAVGAPQSADPGANVLTAEEVQIVRAAVSATALREVRTITLGKKRRGDLVAPPETLALCRDGGPWACLRTSMVGMFGRDPGGAETALGRAFTVRNAMPARFDAFDDRLVIIPPQELDEVFQGPDGWQEFHKRYEQTGVVRFSAPAIAGDEAAVYVMYSCHSLCGKTWLVRLQRHGAEFRVKDVRMLTIS